VFRRYRNIEAPGSWVSLAVGIVSIAVAILAIWINTSTVRESRENYEKTKDLLEEIDKKSAVIETVVRESDKQLRDTLTNLLTEIATPSKPDLGEGMALVLMQKLLHNPEKAPQMMQGLQPLIELSDSQNSLKDREQG